MTVAELLATATRLLGEGRELADPGREARFLLARLLERPEPWLVAHPEAKVDEDLQATLAEWMQRRRAGEPAHYIVGSCPFWGRPMLVTPDVLIPRPESELIVERALSVPLPARPRVLDVGTGSGCLGVTLALELPGAVVTATDLSAPALVVARRNAAAHGADVALACGDLATHVTGPFDVVVANLPYIPEDEMAALPATVREFEPRVALAGGRDGADLVRHLIADLPRLLVPAGVALLEVGPGHSELLAAVITSAGLATLHAAIDAGGIARVLELRHAQ